MPATTCIPPPGAAHATRWRAFTLRYAPEPGSSRGAREQVAARLRGLVDERTLDTCAFCVEELVTNAVHHGLGHVDVRIVADPGELRVEIFDEGGGFPATVEHEPQAPLGGLALVAASVTRWGHGSQIGYVWFDLVADA